MEVAYGDTSVKLGHFLPSLVMKSFKRLANSSTAVSSRSITAEPFTHTGMLATHKVDENITLYGGYVMGWDSVSKITATPSSAVPNLKLNDTTSLSTTTALGRFNDDRASANVGERVRSTASF